jgi:hypothetical protein
MNARLEEPLPPKMPRLPAIPQQPIVNKRLIFKAIIIESEAKMILVTV